MTRGKAKNRIKKSNTSCWDDWRIYAGRKESASTATGLFKRHVVEQNDLINTIFAAPSGAWANQDSSILFTKKEDVELYEQIVKDNPYVI